MLNAYGARSIHAGPRRPCGFTLAELLVVVVLAGCILALVAAIGNKLHRDLNYAAARMAGGDQLRQAGSMLPLDLRGLASAAGDIQAAEARDLSLNVNVTIASAIVCSVTGDVVTLAPFAATDGQPAGAQVASGDSLWMLVDADSAESWHGAAAGTVVSAAICTFVAPVNAPGPPFAPRRAYSVNVGSQHAAYARVGAPVRITRPLRYVIYRAGDGRWYLGLSTWSADLSRFASVQPISGPYGPSVGRDAGTRFSYFDAAGASLPSGLADTRRIARIEARFIPEVVTPVVAGALDSLVLVVALRNAR